MYKRWTIAILLAVILTGCDRGDHPGSIGKAAPEFVIGDGTQSVDLNKLRGKVVVLNLWATWCAGCVEELPSLLALQKKLPNVAVVAVATDQDPEVYHQFLLRNHVDLITVRDADQRINALYGTQLIPETYIIDRNGVIRRKLVGSQNWTDPEFTDYLAKL